MSSLPGPAPVLAAAPTGPVDVPAAVRRLAGGARLTPVWRNGLGGLTFAVGGTGRPGEHDGGRPGRYVKWSPAGTDGPGDELDLVAEAGRLAWAGRWTPVPRVVDHGRDAEGSWLVTAALDATSAVDPRWRDRPHDVATAVGAGLRALHDALPVAGCPWTWSVEDRRARADARLAAGDGPASWFPDHRHLDPADARARLDDVPPVDRLVVCHGDPCTPNTLLAADGTWAAHVDLGALGVADRWADLAVASWSLGWNLGPGHDDALYAAYGVDRDPGREAYYRLLWDVS